MKNKLSIETLNNIKNVKALLFDLDGTLYVSDKLIGDVKNTLQFFRNQGISIVYLTNNSSKSIDAYKQKLSDLDILDKKDVIVSSGTVAINYIKANCSDKKVYLVGTVSFFNDCKKAGVNLSNENADIVLLSYDTELTYEKLCLATKHLNNGANYFATHIDVNCPSKDGFLPDIGSFIALIEKSTGLTPEIYFGKPDNQMANEIMELLSLKNNEIMMIGDRLYTDIQFGINNNFLSCLVLSGESTLDDVQKSAIAPTLILNDVNELKQFFEK